MAKSTAKNPLLSPNQKAILEFMDSFTQKNGYAPSNVEIAKRFNYSSLGTVQHYISTLVEKGYLKKIWNGKRSAQTVHKSECLEVPLLGLVAAGLPIEAIERDQNFSVPASFMKPAQDYFCLKVQGDSMVEDHICDGDIVLIKRAIQCENGDIIVGVVDGSATLKRFKKMKSHIELLPANPKYKPIIVTDENDFRIAGIFSGLFRF